MKILSKITPIRAFLMLALVLALISFALALFQRPALAQQYFTNSASGTFFGAQQYNQAFPSPSQPGQTMARQYLAGINAFTGNTGTFSYATNSWATNYVYYAPPSVTVMQYGAATAIQQTNEVISVTTSNCIVWFGGATAVNYSIQAIGR